MVIGVDLDGVVDDLSEGIIQAFKKKFGLDIEKIIEKNIKKKRRISYHLEDWPEVKRLAGGEKFVLATFSDPRLYRRAEPVKGAREVLKKWRRQGHRIWIITARPPHLENVTLAWLRRHGLGWLIEGKAVIFNNLQNGFRPSDKPRLVEKLGVQVFIEDNLKTLNESRAPALLKKILFKRPYNSGPSFDFLTEAVESWREIDEIVQRLASGR